MCGGHARGRGIGPSPDPPSIARDERFDDILRMDALLEARLLALESTKLLVLLSFLEGYPSRFVVIHFLLERSLSRVYFYISWSGVYLGPSLFSLSLSLSISLSLSLSLSLPPIHTLTHTHSLTWREFPS